MIAKKFAKEVASTQKKSVKTVAVKRAAKKKSVGRITQPKRDRNGRFQKKKK